MRTIRLYVWSGSQVLAIERFVQEVIWKAAVRAPGFVVKRTSLSLSLTPSHTLIYMNDRRGADKPPPTVRGAVRNLRHIATTSLILHNSISIFEISEEFWIFCLDFSRGKRVSV